MSVVKAEEGWLLQISSSFFLLPWFGFAHGWWYEEEEQCDRHCQGDRGVVPIQGLEF